MSHHFNNFHYVFSTFSFHFFFLPLSNLFCFSPSRSILLQNQWGGKNKGRCTEKAREWIGWKKISFFGSRFYFVHLEIILVFLTVSLIHSLFCFWLREYELLNCDGFCMCKNWMENESRWHTLVQRVSENELMISIDCNYVECFQRIFVSSFCVIENDVQRCEKIAFKGK